MNVSDFSDFRESYPNLFLIKAIKAIPLNTNKRAIDASKNYDAILLDSYTKGQHGGTGVVHDWNLSLKIKQIIHPIPIILAGGLKPENVADAINYVQPFAVDVSSGVEKQPGMKDKQKIFDFIKCAKEIRNEKIQRIPN
jgi:phosphoribosylanthranilate isomerase